ncbi:MAG: hypothetical protein VYE73_12870 [Acidobacteriota bacterium]|nr:hypothetical protein [Acidobacteriota bacterium]
MPSAMSGGRAMVVVAVFLTGCAAPRADPIATAQPEEEVELGAIMGVVQRHTQKLGYSIARRNAPLATFYLEELEETVAEVYELEAHDGMVIGQPARTTLEPMVGPLSDRVAVEDWEGAHTGYVALIDACNRCHAATEHEFIVILEPEGPSPYNQAF